MPIQMARKEFVLNYTMNRFQLNYKRSVGAVAEEIRKCRPKTLHDWEVYYFANVRSRKHVRRLGDRLYEEIKNTIAHEERFHPKLVNSITKVDCRQYMRDMVIKRNFDGHELEFA